MLYNKQLIVFDWNGTLVEGILGGGSAKWIEHTLETLHDLQAKGYWLAIATAESRRRLEADLLMLGATHWFMAKVCGDDTWRKPHPEAMFDLLNYCGLESTQAIMVGDTVSDMQFAVNSRVTGIGMLTGLATFTELQQAGAQQILPNLSALSAYLPNLL